MSFNTALTAGQLQSLRGTASASPSHRARLCISLCPNTNVYTARVNQATFGASFAQLTYDGGSGTLANVRVGMTVLISHTNNRATAFFIGRIRKTPAASLIYINETSAAVTDNDYIFILDDFRIWDKLGRMVSSTLYPDYDVTFRQLLPRVSNLKSGYAGTAVSSILTLSFAPAVAASTDGATISSYLWAVGDGTITVGNSTTKDITATFPPGFRWIHFSATDSGGRVSTRHIPVWSHDDTYPVTLLDHGDLSVTASVDEGFSGQISAFAGIDTVLDNTLLCAWLDAETYNGAQTNIAGNIALVGRLRTEDSQTDYADGQQDASTQFDIESPLQQLARLEITSQQIDNAASPTKFNQVDTLTIWREIHLLLTEYSTFEELHSLAFDDVTDNFRETGIVTQAGDLLSAVNALANGLNAAIQMNADGEAEIVRNACLIPTGSRGGLVTVADWDIQDMLSFDITHDHVNVVGKLDASGGSYNTTSGGKLNVALSLSPGVAQDYPSGTGQLANQILTVNQALTAAEAELNIRAGHALAAAQGADELTVAHPPGYWFLTPSLNQWYTFTLAGGETARGIVLTTSTRWQLISVNITHEVETGNRTVEATYRRETSGSPGQAYRLPTQSSTPLTLPSLPALPSLGILDIGQFYLDELTAGLVPANLAGSMSAEVFHDGNTALVWTSAQAFICSDFVKQLKPTWKEITPPLASGETIIAARFVPGSPPGVLLLTNLSSSFDVVYDFSINDWDWSTLPHPPEGTVSQWVSGDGWSSGTIPPGGAGSAWNYIYLNTSGLTAAKVTYDITNQPSGLGADFRIYDGVNGTGSAIDGGVDSITPGTTYVNRTFTVALTLPGRSILLSQNLADYILWRSVTLTIAGGSRVWHMTNIGDTSTWAPGGTIVDTCVAMRIGATFADVYIWDKINANVYYSNNYGASFAPFVVAGTPDATAAGFDTGRLGLVTLAGTDNLIRIATAAGGTYSDYSTLPTDNVATAIFIPRYKFSGANNGIGVSAPDFLFASTVPEAGTGYALWKVTASGVTQTNITPVDGSDKGLAVGPNCLAIPWYSSAYQDIFAILSFAGTRKLAISTNAGGAWTLSGALDAAAAHVATRRSDTARRQLFIANGPNLIYCSNYRASPPILATRIGPTADNVLGVDVLP